MELAPWLTYLLASSLCLAVVGSPKDSGFRVEGLKRLEASSSVAHLDGTKYRNFVLNPPRPYNLVMLYTADQRVCKACSLFEEAHQLAAKAYLQERATNKRLQEFPTFFASVDLSAAKEVAYLHALRHAPLIVFLKPEDISEGKPEDSSHPEAMVLSLPGGDSRFDPDASSQPLHLPLLEFVNGHTGVVVEVRMSFQERAKLMGILMLILVVCSAILWVGAMWIRTHPSIIIVGAMIVQWLSASGICYSMQHGMQMWGKDMNGKELTFAKGRRAQFLGEGLMMGGAYILTAACLLLLVVFPRAKWIQKRGKWLPSILALGCVIAFGFASNMVFNASELKSGIGNDAPFYPPSGYVRGPLMNDRGNSL